MMLFATEIINKSPVERLVTLWSKRYKLDLSILGRENNKIMSSDLIKTASLEGREETIAKLKRLVEINCKCAGIQTSALFSYIPNIVNLWESQRIAQLVGQIYDKVLEVYLQQSPSSQLIAEIGKIAAIDFSGYPHDLPTMPGLEISAIKQLVKGIEGLYQELRQQYLSARDSRAIGFMSTQFHLSSRLLINRLTVWERLLISPYFKFVEEQVCIPWQRVCVAAAKHEINSPALGIIQQLLPVSLDIAQEVHCQAVRLNPNHRSLRGTLDAPDVRASSIRDVEMFQGYLWLCVLEGNTSSVEQELLPLCQMVFPSINVTWELVEQLLPLLVAEIQLRVKPEQMKLVQPYTEAMQKLFAVAG